MSQEAVPSEQSQQAESPRSRRWVRWIGLLLVITAVLLAYFLVIGLLGWQSGQQKLTEAQATALAEEVTKQIELARSDMSDGRFALAQERLSWVLSRAPTDGEAQSLQQEARTKLDQLLTPQPTQTPTPPPTEVPLSTSTPEVVADATERFIEIEQLIEAEAWRDVLPMLTDFQRQFPAYERPATDKWLYDTYIQLGLSLMDGEQVELGMYYLSQARRLGDLPTEVSDYETWAELYLQGIAFYGTNWDASAYYFRNLCLAAPFFHDSCERLHEVLVAYGDQYAVAQDWCPAQQLYEEARQLDVTPGLPQKLEQAVTGCLAATPVPDVITGTFPITQTGLFTAAQPFILPSFETPTAEP